MENLNQEIKYMLKKYPLLDLKEAEDKRDYTLDMVEGINIEEGMPNEFNLEFVQPLKLQYSVGSCVSCAVAMGKDILDDTDEPYSQWFLHGNRNDDDFQGEGAIIRQVLSNISDDGIVYLKDFNEVEHYPKIREILHNKYDYKKLLKKAKEHRSQGYVRLKKKEVKSFIFNEKSPVFIGITIYENFYYAPNNKGLIQEEPKGKELGGHRMLIVGYNGDTLKLANWWGKWGGQDGYLYLDINSDIINDFFALTDKPIKRPHKKKYTVGWNKDKSNNKWIYSDDGEKLFENGWKQISGDWYYFKNTFAIDGDWINDNGWYFLERGSCKMLKNKWLLLGSKWYRLGENGEMLTEWYKNEKEDWFYLDIAKGYAYTGWVFIHGNYYYFNNDCIMQTGWLIDNGNKYYLEEKQGQNQGKMYCGNIFNISGKFYEFDTSGKLIKQY